MKIRFEVDMSDPTAVGQAVSFLNHGASMSAVKAGGHIDPSTGYTNASTKETPTPAVPDTTIASTTAAPDIAPQVNDRNAVKDALKSLAQLLGKDPAVKILNDNGAASISELAESKFDIVHARAMAEINEAPVAPPPADEFC